jgi:dTDP-4-amino-4,6-dideoxygalactose transaminase
MEHQRIFLCLAHMSDEGWEQKYIKEAFDTNWVVPLGPNVNAFEDDLEEFVCHTDRTDLSDLSKRVVALSSGTAAVHLALIACGVQPGDEVIVQSFTFCASSHPITYLGATPVFVDSERETWNMDPELLEEAIKDRIAKTGKKPKAIIPVALYGMPYQIERIMEIANRYEIPVIEDAAEGFGSRYKGQVLGTFGRYGVLSFNGNKMITTSGGGALICPDHEAWQEVMMYATQYRESYPYYQHEKIGYNYRMSNICAGIGRGQMTVAAEHIKHHQHVQKLYEELLADVPGIKVHSQPHTERVSHTDLTDPAERNCHTDLTDPTDSKSHTESTEITEKVYDSNYWLCTITIDPEVKVKGQENAYKTIVTGAVGGAAGVIHAASSAVTDCQPNENVEALRVALDQAGIEARPVWKPMHKQPVYGGRGKKEEVREGYRIITTDKSISYVNGVSEAIFKVGMCLPAGPYVSDEDVKYIVETIKKIVR